MSGIKTTNEKGEIGKIRSEYILYENSNGTYTNIYGLNLKDYKYIDIQYYANLNYSTVRIYNPINKKISFMIDGESSVAGWIYICSATIKIYETYIEFVKNLQIWFNSSSIASNTDSSDWYKIKITKIVGYK